MFWQTRDGCRTVISTTHVNIICQYRMSPRVSVDLLNTSRFVRRDLGGELAAVDPNKVVIAVAEA